MENFNQFTILYIEDDEGVRNINSRFLSRMFNKLYEARDGEEGFSFYKKYKPDIILTDINMPKLDGLSLAKKIREHDFSTKIIISTAHSDKDYLLKAIELKLEKYIIKPLNSRNLLPVLNKAVESLQNQKDSKTYISKNFYFDNRTSLFYENENEINMTKKELLFLKLLVTNKKRIVSYEEIENFVWGEEYMSLNSLRTTIGFLRKKIPYNCIKNISNLGYKLNFEEN